MENQEGKEVKKPKKRAKQNLTKPDAFEIYILWYTLPRGVRRLQDATLEGLGFDLEDPLFNELRQIRTRTQFAKRYNVTRTTMWSWEKRDDFIDKVKEFGNREILLQYKRDIDFAFTEKTKIEGDAARVKLWKQLFEGWEEKSTVRSESKDMKVIADAFRKFAEEKDDQTK
jgi:hypothetical protein